MHSHEACFDRRWSFCWSQEPIRRFRCHARNPDLLGSRNRTPQSLVQERAVLTRIRLTSSLGTATTYMRTSNSSATSAATRATSLTTTGPGGPKIHRSHPFSTAARLALVETESTLLGEITLALARLPAATSSFCLARAVAASRAAP